MPYRSGLTFMRGLGTKRCQDACALSLYTLVSILFFGLPLLGHFAHRCIGDRADPFIQIWALAWWPHALASGENPIITQAVWAPAGYNLTRTVSMPAPGLILFPITKLFGPIV